MFHRTGSGTPMCDRSIGSEVGGETLQSGIGSSRQTSVLRVNHRFVIDTKRGSFSATRYTIINPTVFGIEGKQNRSPGLLPFQKVFVNLAEVGRVEGQMSVREVNNSKSIKCTLPRQPVSQPATTFQWLTLIDLRFVQFEGGSSSSSSSFCFQNFKRTILHASILATFFRKQKCQFDCRINRWNVERERGWSHKLANLCSTSDPD